MKRVRSGGFTPVEAIVALVIVAALIGVGWWVMNRQPDKQDSQTNTSQAADNEETSEAPAVENSDDLDAAEKALDSSDLDAGADDNEDISQELNAF